MNFLFHTSYFRCYLTHTFWTGMTTKESLLKSLRDLPVLTKDTLAIAAATNLLFKIYFIYYEYSSYIKELKTFFKVQ